MVEYVITLSRNFTLKHPKHGEPTNFCESTLNAIWQAHGVKCGYPQFGAKLHTIRGNYALWKKRFQKINAGKAVLSIRYWSGKPYYSKQSVLSILDTNGGIGLQKLEFYNGCLQQPIIEGKTINMELIAKNDGLNIIDWQKWFEKEDLNEKFAIIHFTKFRY